MRHSYFWILLLALSSQISVYAADGFPDIPKIYQSKIDEQGNLLIRKAENFFQDRLYENCIEELKTFALIYPFHPRLKDSWKLLSRAHQKQRDFDQAIHSEMAIYLEFPTHQEGYEAFLEAGRTHLKLGNWDMAERIFTEIMNQSYFPEIAREAELELKQIRVLHKIKSES
jgi:outer membrane protein assembly factor BamD (BamD/ComL family)